MPTVRTVRRRGRRPTAPQPVGFLVQGTLYPDVIESGSDKRRQDQVAPQRRRAPRGPGLRLVEPLRLCSRTRSRRSAEELACPRHRLAPAVPGPGLAVRIVGEVTPERTEILRDADAIVVEEVRRAGLYRGLCRASRCCPAVAPSA